VLRQLLNYWKPGVSVVAVQPVTRAEASRYGIVFGRVNADGTMRVSHLVEKPPESEVPEAPLAIMGRYILDPVVFSLLADLPAGAGGEIQLTDALDLLAREHQLLAVPYEGKRYDVGEKVGFVKATIDAALARDDMRDEILDYLRQVLEATLAGEKSGG
jgi:UTP--glucose-1-phosphate uridylyltransferase